MDKAEELKQQFIFDWQPSDQQESIHNQNFRHELDILLDKVSREMGIEFGVWVQENQGKENFDFNRSDSDGWYDDWKSNQEEQS